MGWPISNFLYNQIPLSKVSVKLIGRSSDLEESITYEPVQGPSLSADPVIQAVGVDEATQELLNGALDRVLDALSADGLGPVDADLVPSWVVEGFREAIAP